MSITTPGNFIEASYTGPLPNRKRGAIRLGSYRSFEKARARAMVHHLSNLSLKVLRNFKRQSPTKPFVANKFGRTPAWHSLRDDLRFYLNQRAKWKRYLKKFGAARQVLRRLCFA